MSSRQAINYMISRIDDEQVLRYLKIIITDVYFEIGADKKPTKSVKYSFWLNLLESISDFAKRLCNKGGRLNG